MHKIRNFPKQIYGYLFLQSSKYEFWQLIWVHFPHFDAHRHHMGNRQTMRYTKIRHIAPKPLKMPKIRHFCAELEPAPKPMSVRVELQNIIQFPPCLFSISIQSHRIQKPKNVKMISIQFWDHRRNILNTGTLNYT